MPPATPRPQPTPQRIEPRRSAADAPDPRLMVAVPSSAKPAPVIVWEEPAAVRTRNLAEKVGEDILAALRAQPGRWAKVRTYPNPSSASTAANAINKKRVLGPGWEAAGRRAKPAPSSVLYLRWVGAGATPKETA